MVRCNNNTQTFRMIVTEHCARSWHSLCYNHYQHTTSHVIKVTMKKKQLIPIVAIIIICLAGYGLIVAYKLHGNNSFQTATKQDLNAPKIYTLVISKDAIKGPNTVTIKKGVPTRINVSAIDQPETDLSIRSLGLNTSTQGGSVSNFDFTPTKAGTFDIRLTRREAESDDEGTIDKVVGRLVVE